MGPEGGCLGKNIKNYEEIFENFEIISALAVHFRPKLYFRTINIIHRCFIQPFVFLVPNETGFLSSVLRKDGPYMARCRWITQIE